jgi:hypothetical protein
MENLLEKNPRAWEKIKVMKIWVAVFIDSDSDRDLDLYVVRWWQRV